MKLTLREQQVVTLMGHGWTNKLIAQRLGLSPKTVKCHAVKVYRKLGAMNRAHAATIWARRENYRGLA